MLFADVRDCLFVVACLEPVGTLKVPDSVQSIIAVVFGSHWTAPLVQRELSNLPSVTVWLMLETAMTEAIRRIGLQNFNRRYAFPPLRRTS